MFLALKEKHEYCDKIPEIIVLLYTSTVEPAFAGLQPPEVGSHLHIVANLGKSRDCSHYQQYISFASLFQSPL